MAEVRYSSGWREAKPSFGKLLRRHREAAGLSREALAARSGLSEDAIGLLERSARRRPPPDTVRRLAAALALDAPDRMEFEASAEVERTGAPRAVRVWPRAALTIPRELPRSPADFTGRSRELVSLWKLLAAGAREGPAAIVTIDGMAGVGKSALAVHVAQRLADGDRFPEGQLYVNLHGATVLAQ